jgi:hypothetical protein
MRLKYFLLSFLIIGFVYQLSFAQVSVVDKQGDKIILMPDGTWQYADQDKQAAVNNTVKEQQKTGQANIDKTKLSKAEKKQIEEQAKADERRKAIAAKLAKQEQAKQPKNTDKNKTVAKESTDKKNKNTAQKNTTPKKEDNKKNTVQTTDKKNTDKKTTSKKNNNNIATEKKPAPNSDTKTANAKKTNNTTDANAKAVSNKQDVKLAKQSFKPFKASQIIIQEEECVYAVNEIDPFTGKRKVALENKFFFGFTHPLLEKHLKGEHYLTCDGYLQQVAGMKIFNVKFTVDSPNAVDDYGSILEGSRMLVSLLDGTTVTLISAEEDGGKVDRIDKSTTYKTYFVIDAKQEKQLLKSEINQVRMVWSEGFEDYEIYEVDFLMSQLKCLNNIPKS